MKNIIAFFVMIYNWFISLFKKEEVKVIPEKISTPEIKWSHKAEIPIHNNRRNTRGRHIQTTPSGRVIFHGAK